MEIDQSIKSKWICLYLIKGRNRYLEMFKLYFNGTLDKYPVASICLDEPLVLLDPSHPRCSSIRPSVIAESCDLFADPLCYGLLRLVEEQIIATAVFTPRAPEAFVISELDAQFQPAKVARFEYADALSIFTTHARNLHLPITPKVCDPDGELREIFAVHAADLRSGQIPPPPPSRRRGGRRSIFSNL